MQLPHRNQTLPKEVELVLVWRWLPKIEMVCVINRWRVKPRLRQTADAKLYRVTNFFLLLFSSAVYYFFMEIIFFSGYVHRSVFFNSFICLFPKFGKFSTFISLLPFAVDVRDSNAMLTIGFTSSSKRDLFLVTKFPRFFLFFFFNNNYLVTTLLMTILTFTWRKSKNNVQEIKEKYNVIAFATN